MKNKIDHFVLFDLLGIICRIHFKQENIKSLAKLKITFIYNGLAI